MMRLHHLSYFVCAVGAIMGIVADLYVARRWGDLGWSMLGEGLWVVLPFVLTVAVVYLVRGYRVPSCGALVFAVLLAGSSCLCYAPIQDEDSMPVFALGFTPILQLFCIVVGLTPVLAGAWFLSLRDDDGKLRREKTCRETE